MNAIQKVFRWGDTHHPGWLDLIRVALGVLLFYKGLEFARNPHELSRIGDGSDFLGMGLTNIFLLHFLPLAHFGGGLMIALGLFTRFAILFQLPILAGAVIFTGRATGYFDLYSQFGLALLVFFLLIFFLVWGSGPYSADAYLREETA